MFISSDYDPQDLVLGGKAWVARLVKLFREALLLEQVFGTLSRGTSLGRAGNGV